MEIGIELTESAVKGKKEVKTKIEEKMKIGSKKQESKKMRFLQKKGHETYINEIHYEDARMALKIRLNVVES